MFDFNNLKIYSHSWAGHDWGFSPQQFIDADSALVQPFSIAAVPAMCNEPDNFIYSPSVAAIDLSKFDLVLISSIEMTSTEVIQSWAKQNNIHNYLIAQGSYQTIDKNDDDVIYRPWWAFNLLNTNKMMPVEIEHRPYQFECLLGARRPHRDFVMLSFQQSNLLDLSIVTYRDVFNGNLVDQESANIAQQFTEKLKYPYVSSNLCAEWETAAQIDNKISCFLPWEIYRRCNYSVVCETHSDKDNFFLSEKTGKVLLGQRLFIHVGSYNFLSQLHKLGFETFENIIDESYDTIIDDVARYSAAFDQVKMLAKDNPQLVLKKVWPRLVHNRLRMIHLQSETKQRMAKMIEFKIQNAC